MAAISWIQAVLDAVGDMLLLRVPDVLRGVDGHSRLPVAVGVALLAAFATLVGHGVIFMLNRVRGVRLAVSMALGAVYLVLLHALTGLVIGAVSSLLVGAPVSVTSVVVVYLLSLAPRTLGFLVFIPHLGLGIGRVIEGWCLLTLFLSLAYELQLAPWHALLVGGTAWLVAQVVSRLLARPLASVVSVVWSRVTGSPTFLTSHDVLAGAPFVPLDRSSHEVLR